MLGLNYSDVGEFVLDSLMDLNDPGLSRAVDCVFIC